MDKVLPTIRKLMSHLDDESDNYVNTEYFLEVILNSPEVSAYTENKHKYKDKLKQNTYVWESVNMMKMKVDSLLDKVNQILMRRQDFPEDTTAEIEHALATWAELPFVKFYENGLCPKIKESSSVKTYASYISEASK